MFDSLRKALSAAIPGKKGDIAPFQPARHLLIRDFDPVCVDGFRPRSIVFVLEFAPKGGGGLADVLHLGMELSGRHGWHVYFLVTGRQDHASVVGNITWANPAIDPACILATLDFVPEFLCATAWPTAYDILKLPSRRKLYFVQDYEPMFYRAGSARWYAEKSYRLGLEMFTLGRWLPEKLKSDQDVTAMGLPFPATDAYAAGSNPRDRSLVSVYVQPDKEHRGTEMLMTACRMILPEVKRRGCRIVLFGSRQNEWINPGFDCEVRGVLPEPELKALLSSTRLGVSASFTNVSLLPPRFLAHGAQIVEADLPGVVMNLPGGMGGWIRYAPPHPAAFGEVMLAALDHAPESPLEHYFPDYQQAHAWSVFADRLAAWLDAGT